MGGFPDLLVVESTGFFYFQEAEWRACLTDTSVGSEISHRWKSWPFHILTLHLLQLSPLIWKLETIVPPPEVYWLEFLRYCKWYWRSAWTIRQMGLCALMRAERPQLRGWWSQTDLGPSERPGWGQQTAPLPSPLGRSGWKYQGTCSGGRWGVSQHLMTYRPLLPHLDKEEFGLRLLLKSLAALDFASKLLHELWDN